VGCRQPGLEVWSGCPSASKKKLDTHQEEKKRNLREDIDKEAKLAEDTLGLAKATGSTVLLALFLALAQLIWL